MSEEETINIINNFLNYKVEKYLSSIELRAIRNLLYLYNLEKEMRKNSEENYNVLSLDILRACKDLGLSENIISDELVLEINKKYISKDKIKELL